jgi:hypothetical protein
VNQRIRELERQALIGVLNGNDPDGDVDRMYIPAEFTKKFAELIVGECSGIVQKHMSRWPEDCELTKQIKQNFGVEE